MRAVAGRGEEWGRLVLSVRPLKIGQEDYWLNQVARDREEYFSGHGESPGRFVGSLAERAGLSGVASGDEVRAMFRGQDPATGQQRVKPLWRADPRSKLAAGPLAERLQARAAEQGGAVEELAGSKALQADVRSVQHARKPGQSKRVKVETVERLCRKVLDLDPRAVYGGEGFDQAWRHRGKRVDERVASFDLCLSSPKSVSLLAAAGGEHRRQQVAAARAVAVQAAIGYLQANGAGVRRDHNGVDRQQTTHGFYGVAFEHRLSREGDPDVHTHLLVQNATPGPDGRWSALDSERLYAHVMAADHLHLAVERAELTRRLGVRWTAVDERSGAAEIVGLDDRALIDRSYAVGGLTGRRE